MKTGTIASLALLATSLSTFAHADFKYTQQSKMTGGSLLAMTKTLGVFSKNMRQANEPQNSTVMVKGNRLRTEHANGNVEIIDLDQRRFVYIDPEKKTYSIVTFDEFKAAMQRAQERAREEQAKEARNHPDQNNVKVTPKFEANATGASRDILGMKANEMKMRMEMLVESTDPQAQQKPQSGSFSFDSDAWLAPSVNGYDEVHNFHVKLAKELDWYPNMLGSLGMANPRMGPAMVEFRKNAEKVKGMPMLQYVSIGATGTGPADSDSSEPSRDSSRAQKEEPEDSTIPTSTSQAVMKGLGGMFHKKKKEQEQAQEKEAAQTTTTTTSPDGRTKTSHASLIEMMVEVTSISTSSLDGSLFDVPTGYKQVQRNADEAFGGKR